MPVNSYINFDGNCKEALCFYETVFETEKAKILTFGDMTEDKEWKMPEEAKERVMHAQLTICGSTVMFSDLFPGMPYQVGNHISLAIVSDEEAQLTKYYNRLKEGGVIEMPLQATDWSPCYASIIDKFGVGWQINMQK